MIRRSIRIIVCYLLLLLPPHLLPDEDFYFFIPEGNLGPIPWVICMKKRMPMMTRTDMPPMMAPVEVGWKGKGDGKEGR